MRYVVQDNPTVATLRKWTIVLEDYHYIRNYQEAVLLKFLIRSDVSYPILGFLPEGIGLMQHEGLCTHCRCAGSDTGPSGTWAILDG